MFKFGFYNPNDYATEKGYEYVTSPETFVKGKLTFDPHGLFSEVIWPYHDNLRFTKKAIIDLRKGGVFFHPKFLAILKSHSKLLYNSAIGASLVTLNEKNELEAGKSSGYQGLGIVRFLIENIDKIENLNQHIRYIISTFREKILIDSIFVLPPALRDIIIKDGRIINKPVINTYYEQILRIVPTLDYTREELLKLERQSISSYQKWYRVQNLIYKIYKEEVEELKSKAGFIRKNLLGKRVDFSGRAVASVNPKLPHDTIAVPYYLGAKLFEPFIAYVVFTEQPQIKEKLQQILKRPITEATFSTEMKLFRDGHYPPEAERIIKDIMDTHIAKKYPLVMKRDPGLHRMSLQGFNVVFTDDKTIQVAPMVTGGYNLDFDGDSIDGDVTLRIKNKQTGQVHTVTENILNLKSELPVPK